MAPQVFIKKMQRMHSRGRKVSERVVANTNEVIKELRTVRSFAMEGEEVEKAPLPHQAPCPSLLRRLSATYYLLLTTYYLPPTTYYLLLTTYHLLHYLPLTTLLELSTMTTYYLLLTTYYLLHYLLHYLG